MRALQEAVLPGYTRALKSSFHDGPLRGMDNAFKMIAKYSHLKCLIVHVRLSLSAVLLFCLPSITGHG